MNIYEKWCQDESFKTNPCPLTEEQLKRISWIYAHQYGYKPWEHPSQSEMLNTIKASIIQQYGKSFTPTPTGPTPNTGTSK